MFCSTDCIELITRIPQGAVASLALAKRFGLRQRWVCKETRYRGRDVPYSVWSMTLFDWLPADEESLMAVLAAMKQYGQEAKAQSWFVRWAALSQHLLNGKDLH